MRHLRERNVPGVGSAKGASGDAKPAITPRISRRFRALRRQPLQMRGQQRVSDVLDATEQLLRRKRFDLITMEDVARRAGLRFGSLYFFFRNKSSVFVSVVERVLQAEADTFRAVSAGKGRSLSGYLCELEQQLQELWAPRRALLDLYLAYQRHPAISCFVLELRAQVSRDIAGKLHRLYPGLRMRTAIDIGEQIGIVIAVLHDNLAYTPKSAHARLRRECFAMLRAYVLSRTRRPRLRRAA